MGRFVLPIRVVEGDIGGKMAPYAIRTDAELVESFQYDKHIVADEEKTIPAFSTTRTTFISSETVATIDASSELDEYDYYIVYRTLTIPEYGTTSAGKGRFEWALNARCYELVKYDVGAWKPLSNPEVTYPTSNPVATVPYSSIDAMGYWTSGTAFTAANVSSYGTSQNVLQPTFNQPQYSTVTVKSPELYISGHSTYLTQTYYDEISDIRYQYIIDIYRAPKTGDHDGWSIMQCKNDIVSCLYSDNHKLV